MLTDYLVHARGVSVVVHAGEDRCITFWKIVEVHARGLSVAIDCCRTFWEIGEVHPRGLYVAVHAGRLLSYIPGDCGSTR